MSPLARAAMLVALAGACVAFLSCEKETHRAARREFQALMARGLPPAEQAQALEDFVTRFPEPSRSWRSTMPDPASRTSPPPGTSAPSWRTRTTPIC